MTGELTTRLTKLSDINLAIEPTEDIRGPRVVDDKCEEVGQVDDLIVDEREVRVRFIEVATFGLLAGRSRYHLPVDAITSVDERTVSVRPDRREIDSAPQYQSGVMDVPYLRSLYAYYGYMPFWQDGYVYPPYPYYPRTDMRRRA